MYDLALADCEGAIKLSPKWASAFDTLGRLRASCPDPEVRDAGKAIEAATRAYVLGGDEEPSYLGTLAAAYAEAGEFEKALRWQEEANRRFTRAFERAEGEERLKQYWRGKPYRRPWPDELGDPFQPIDGGRPGLAKTR